LVIESLPGKAAGQRGARWRHDWPLVRRFVATLECRVRLCAISYEDGNAYSAVLPRSALPSGGTSEMDCECHQWSRWPASS
jgi:hypothetical protein